MRELAGLRIVVTRAAHQAEELARPLRDLGAEAILLPVIGIAPPADPVRLRTAAQNVVQYDWIVFTSANAVQAFAAELPDQAAMRTTRIAAVGSATRETAEECGFKVAVVPERYVAESLVEAFAGEDIEGRRILIPSAAVTRDVVSIELRRRGARVDVVEAYRNVIPNEAAERAASVICEPYPDWLTFASSSAVNNLMQLVGTAPLRLIKIATIGPVTSETARRHGLQVAVTASVHTMQGLVDAISVATRPV